MLQNTSNCISFETLDFISTRLFTLIRKYHLQYWIPKMEEQFHSASPGHCWSTWYSTHVVWPWQSIGPWALSFLPALPPLNDTSWDSAQRTSSWLAKNSVSNSFAFPWLIAMDNSKQFHFYSGFRFSPIWCVSNGFIIWSPQLSPPFSAELKQQSGEHLHWMDVCVPVLQPWPPPSLTSTPPWGSDTKPRSWTRLCWALSPLIRDVLLSTSNIQLSVTDSFHFTCRCT